MLLAWCMVLGLGSRMVPGWLGKERTVGRRWTPAVVGGGGGMRGMVREWVDGEGRWTVIPAGR